MTTVPDQRVVTGPNFYQERASNLLVAGNGNAFKLGDLLSGAAPGSSTVTGLTAKASGTQASATALTATINNVTTVATGADAVQLPLAQAGLEVLVVNSDPSNAMQVFGSGTDTINGVATATGVSQAAGKTALYVCVTSAPAGKWFRLLSA